MKKCSEDEYSLEVQDFYERIPDSMNTKLVCVAGVILIGLLLAGGIIKTPMVISANIQITGEMPPQVLYSRNAGKLVMLVDSLPSKVSAGSYIAYLSNTADARDILALKDAVLSYRPEDLAPCFPDFHSRSLGDISTYYYSLEKCVLAYQDIQRYDNQYWHRINAIQTQLENDSTSLAFYSDIVNHDRQLLEIKRQEYLKDSLLFNKEAILEGEKNLSKKEYYNMEKEVLSEIKTIDNLNRNIKQYYRDLEQEKKLLIDTQRSALGELYNAYNTLTAKIVQWEDQYVFMANYDGIVEYASVISENAFIAPGEPVFTVVGENSDYYGVALLRPNGAGMVECGQRTMIKIPAYPYEEYGLLEGIVSGTSMNHTSDGGYYVYITLPEGLKSTNGTVFSFAKAMEGQVDIVTKESRLIEKLFRHLCPVR